MGFWTDWLDPNSGSEALKPQASPIPPGSDGRSWWDKLAGIPVAVDVFCGGCGEASGRCRCDPKIGRPRRWFE